MNKYSHREAFSKLSSTSRTHKRPSPSPSNDDKVSVSNLAFPTHSIPEFNNKIPPMHRKSSSMGYIPTLSHHNSISSLTKVQNDLVADSLSKILQDKKEHFWFPDLQSQSMLRSDHDFNKIINKLNRVIFPDINKRPIFFNDSENFDLTLDEGQTQLGKVYVKGKKTPLIMKIQRLKGKVLTYVSFYDKEPGPGNYDRYYTTDYIEVRENMQMFKYKYIYFALKAVDYSEFRIQLTFGKISDLNELKRLKKQLTLLRPGRLSTDNSPTLQKSKQSTKDFILLNKSIKLLNSNLNGPELKKRAEEWKVRHKQIIGKKKILLVEKLSKHQKFLNRQEIRKKNREEEEVRKIEKDVRREIEQRWVGILFFVVSSQGIRRVIQENRGKKLKKIDINMKAMKIQRIFRGLTKNLDKNDKCLIRARNHLLMYQQLTRHCVLKQVKLKLFNYIVAIARDYIATHKLNV